jgi:cyclophilin family peptidyl-prolyl cis-trans isomerase
MIPLRLTPGRRLAPLLFATAVGCGALAADVDFTIQGRPYRVVTTTRTFAAAEADAISKGGHLVHIDTQAENDAILVAVTAAVPSGSIATDGGGARYVWIGGLETSEGTYAWNDNQALAMWTGGKTGAAASGTYVNWGRNTVSSSGPEPDNSNGTQNRVAMAVTAWPSDGTSKIGQSGQWNDIIGTNVLAYVIEFDGMWASFRMSHGGVSKGTFTAKLFYDKVSLTVGNFVGLAGGTQAFVDEKSGSVVKRRFYDGIKCHRVIANFMIQGGCPRGTGTSGPGYEFPDEFDSTLRHTASGMLSMANSGEDTNGSQFFVTVAPTTWLDDKHSIFGQVVDGYATVVQPLSLAPTVDPVNEDNRPVQDVIIEEVTIHRAGTAAQAFAPALPVVGLVPLTAAPAAGGQCMLDFPRTAFGGCTLLQTGDLTSWVMEDIGNLGDPPYAGVLHANALAPQGAMQRYFRMARVTYPMPGAASLVGRKIVVESASLRVTYNLSSVSGGTYNVYQASSGFTQSGNIQSWTWVRSSWGGHLSAALAAGEFLIGADQIRFIDADLRPATNLARGALFLADHDNYYNLPGISRLTITALP